MTLLLATGAANAVSVSSGGVFNMYSQAGLDTTPTNMAAAINVDATIAAFVDQDMGTWGVSSNALFYGLNWTASGGSLITAAGSYALNTTDGSVSAGTGPIAADGTMHFTVGAGQVAGTINFAWGATTGIRVVNVWDVNADGSLTAAHVAGMENGPFPGFNAAFNLTGAGLISPVPVPAAVWLFGSGLLGLVGVARRRKTA
ncbi:MAG: VPLPA-CTERM sorting domain-containing protein [Gammaproteobacteria bacterium]|nr:VPLPA-CTERM sorting domain-containing protein [Gammaproteobacteria bacterium]